MEITIDKCSRCDKDGETIVMYAVPAGGHSWIRPLDLATATPPKIEHVCGDCIKDFEFSMMLTPVVEFVLSGMIRDVAKQKESDWRNQQLTRLESVRAYFTVLNYKHDNRSAALRALGFKPTTSEELVKK